MSGCLLYPDAEDGTENVKSEQPRNEAPLNCASLRSRVHNVAIGAQSADAGVAGR